MTIKNALNFIKQGLNDSTLRNRLNKASSLPELEEILAGENILFSSDEFEQAVYQRLTQCQETEDAEQIKEFSMWWNLLSRILESVECNIGEGAWEPDRTTGQYQ